MAALKLITLRDIQSERVHFLWEPYIPRGKITIVQGDPGDGKTTLLLAIAAAVTDGSPLPGNGGRSVPADVIFQTAEDGLVDTIKPRLEKFSADCDRIHVIDEEETALTFSDARIEQAIMETGAKLFVFDPLQAYLGGAGMHSANGIRPLMKSLGAVAERTGCAIVIIGHLNKKGGKAPYRGLGSVDIYAAARSVLYVGKLESEDNSRAVVHGKSNITSTSAPIAFGLDENGCFEWRGECEITADELLSGKGNGTKPDSQFAKAKKFLENILTGRSVTAVDVLRMAKEQGISEKTLRRAKSALGVTSPKRENQYFWELPIVVEFTSRDVPPDRQGSQDGHTPAMTSLAILPMKKVN